MKPAFFGGKRDGIYIQFNRSKSMIHVCGWYDTYVGIEGESISLHEFIARIGITKADVAKAMKEGNKSLDTKREA